MSLKKYLWKARVLLVETDSYDNKDYIKAKDTYLKHIKRFHQRFTIFKTNRNKDNKFKIKLIGLDGEVKKTYRSFVPSKIFKAIDKMPMGDLKNEKPLNLSLYSDYNQKTSQKGLGYKDKETAQKTIKKIKGKPHKYQMSVINTMLGRAKTHPHQTKNMKEAIKIFKQWIDRNKN